MQPQHKPSSLSAAHTRRGVLLALPLLTGAPRLARAAPWPLGGPTKANVKPLLDVPMRR